MTYWLKILSLADGNRVIAIIFRQLLIE